MLGPLDVLKTDCYCNVDWPIFILAMPSSPRQQATTLQVAHDRWKVAHNCRPVEYTLNHLQSPLAFKFYMYTYIYIHAP